jgi:hypothetical protein
MTKHLSLRGLGCSFNRSDHGNASAWFLAAPLGLAAVALMGQAATPDKPPKPEQKQAATVVDLPLDRTKEMKSLSVRALANEVVIGLMSVTLAR